MCTTDNRDGAERGTCSVSMRVSSLYMNVYLYIQCMCIDLFMHACKCIGLCDGYKYACTSLKKLCFSAPSWSLWTDLRVSNNNNNNNNNNTCTSSL